MTANICIDLQVKTGMLFKYPTVAVTYPIDRAERIWYFLLQQ